MPSAYPSSDKLTPAGAGTGCPSRRRLLRYCARPTFALERLELLDAERVVYRLPKPRRDGTTALTLTPPDL